MASITVKLPQEQKDQIEDLADEKNYNSVSEYVREALRDKAEEDLELRDEIVKELMERIEEENDFLTTGELKKELDIK